jgi:kinesin family protein 5
MSGFNGTVMAYGQTSAGKSFTMEGPSLLDTSMQGVIPRCIDKLFDEINRADANVQFQVIVSYYEIYCEKVRDLLNPQQTNMKIREAKNGGFIVQDITELSCTGRESVLRVIEQGKANRASAPTLMNAESSRSHSIFSISIDQRNSQTGRHKRGTLYLVDLAGSEKVSKTGASGMRLEEAKNINSSLTTLGMVINALCDAAAHVPYRDSKLTMLLMEALGGNSKTTLIICCNPESKHSPETLSTLRFGERAKRVKNHAKVNEELSIEELKALLQAAKKEIAFLKKRSVKLSLEGTEDVMLSLPDDVKALMEPVLAPHADSALLMDMTERMKSLEEEVGALKGRIRSLEEELETERLRYSASLHFFCFSHGNVF